jgi:hypothetical protein
VPRQLITEVLLRLWMLKRGRYSLVNFKSISLNFCVLSAPYYWRVARVVLACHRGVIRAVDARERQALSCKLTTILYYLYRNNITWSSYPLIRSLLHFSVLYTACALEFGWPRPSSMLQL